jgi:hypothetical protein
MILACWDIEGNRMLGEGDSVTMAIRTPEALRSGSCMAGLSVGWRAAARLVGSGR